MISLGLCLVTSMLRLVLVVFVDNQRSQACHKILEGPKTAASLIV
jgi:hypothetical protein